MRGCAAGIRAVLLLGLALAGSGCVGARGYFSDRWADAKDVFTASVGTGGGVKARVGPINAGVFLNEDHAGLRGGECFHYPYGFAEGGTGDAVLLVIYGGEVFDLRHVPPPSSEDVWPRRREPNHLQMVGYSLAARSKCFEQAIFPPRVFKLSKAPYYYTQIEVAAGVVGTLRLGFNPGELLDFVLGWFCIDIYGDDLNARREREARAKPPEKEKPPPAAPPANPPAPAALPPAPRSEAE